MWYKNPVIKELIFEVAAECNVTPKQVLGVLVCYFDSITRNVIGQRVKMFRLPYFGRLNYGTYVSKKSMSSRDAAKRNKKTRNGGFGERALTSEEIAQGKGTHSERELTSKGLAQ